MHKRMIRRRTFLKQTAGAAVGTLSLPLFIPSSAMGNAGSTPPSERITMASIGCGGMGTNNLRAFLAQPDVQVLAVCDVVEANDQYGHWYKKGWNGAWFGREPARKIVEEDYAQKNPSGSYKGCDAYVDFREIIARDDIDAVCVTTPDHWHAIPVIMAATAGKDIYCEKPLSLTVAEGRAMAEAAQAVQQGLPDGHDAQIEPSSTATSASWSATAASANSSASTRPSGRTTRRPRRAIGKPMPVPEWLDYDMWLGPAPWAPYHKDRCLYTFRFGLDYSGGQTTNLAPTSSTSSSGPTAPTTRAPSSSRIRAANGPRTACSPPPRR